MGLGWALSESVHGDCLQENRLPSLSAHHSPESSQAPVEHRPTPTTGKRIRWPDGYEPQERGPRDKGLPKSNLLGVSFQTSTNLSLRHFLSTKYGNREARTLDRAEEASQTKE